MNIHGLVYLIVGLFITGFSYYVTAITDAFELSKFSLFILVGIGFIVVGLFKLIVGMIQQKPKIAKENYPHHRPVVHSGHGQQSSHDHQHPAHTHQHKHRQDQNPSMKFCSQCGTTLRHFDKFCYKCGSREFRG